MTASTTEQNQRTRRPRALLLAIRRPDVRDDDHRRSMNELERLAQTLGIDVVDRIEQNRARPSASTYLGSGKLAEASQLTTGVEFVLVNDDLTPRQFGTLYEELGAEPMDRAGVILKIFEARARTKRARLEVELARLHYDLPRVREQRGGDDRRGGGGRGERGHTNVELEKERIRDRIAEVEAELTGAHHDEVVRRSRRGDTFQIALVGYTNAGKSTLMAGLSQSEIYVEDQLFATLGTTVRRLTPPTTPPMLICDTVGFIDDLPHELVASFRSTLDEALVADFNALIVDCSDPAWREQLRVCRKTLEEIGVAPTRIWEVFNKIDAAPREVLKEIQRDYPGRLQISAEDPASLKRLREAFIARRDATLCEESLAVPFAQGKLRAEIFEGANVLEETSDEDGVVLKVRAAGGDLDRWRSMLPPPGPSPDQPHSPDELARLASSFGLSLRAVDESFDQSGLDFRVARAVDDEENRWILRAPRRPDVFESSRMEARALRVIADEVSFAVPRFQLHTPELIAYRALPGGTAWSLGPDGELSWNVFTPDAPDEEFLASLGRTIAELQSIPARLVEPCGVPVHSVDEVRRRLQEELEETRSILDPPASILDRWRRWLDDDAIWPTSTRLVHGDLHPGHLLIDDSGAILGIIDWTELHFGDPGLDFSMVLGCFGDEALAQVLEHFQQAGGRRWEAMEQHIAARWEFTAVTTAAWGLKHDDQAVVEHARAHLRALPTTSAP